MADHESRSLAVSPSTFEKAKRNDAWPQRPSLPYDWPLVHLGLANSLWTWPLVQQGLADTH